MARIPDMIQGSKSWHTLRQTKLGATSASICMNLNPWKSRLQLWEEMMGISEPAPINAKMKRGTDMEEPARQAYIKESGYNVKPAILVSDIHNFMMASMDGITDDGKNAVEVKCGDKSYKEALNGFIPGYYVAQLQHQMFVCELEVIDYWCFNGKEGILIPVRRNNEFIESMIKAEKEFYHCIVNLTPPHQEYYIYPWEVAEEAWSKTLDETWEKALKDFKGIHA